MRTSTFALLVSAFVAFTVASNSDISSDLSNYVTAVNNLLDANGRSLNAQESTVPTATNTAMNSGDNALNQLRSLASNPSLTTKRKNYVTYDAPTQMAMKEQATQLANIQARVSALTEAREQRAAEYARAPTVNIEKLLQSENEITQQQNNIGDSFVNDNSAVEQNEAAYQAYRTNGGAQQEQAVLNTISTKKEAQSYIPTAFTSEERNVFDALSKRLAQNQ